MPVRKRQQPFAWDEEKKRVVAECLARAREAGGTRSVIVKTIHKEFVKTYPECKLAASTLYKLALDAASKKQLPGETESRVSRWTFEKDRFLIDCEARAREEDLRCRQQGLHAGKGGHSGQYQKLVVQYFTEKYNEHTSKAIYLRIYQLRREGKIVINDVGDNVHLYNLSVTSLTTSDAENSSVASLLIGGADNPSGANLLIGGTDSLQSPIANFRIGDVGASSVANRSIGDADEFHPPIVNLRIDDVGTSSVANQSIGGADGLQSPVANFRIGGVGASSVVNLTIDGADGLQSPVADFRVGGAGASSGANLLIGGTGGLQSPIANFPIGGVGALSVANLTIGGADELPPVANLQISDAGNPIVAKIKNGVAIGSLSAANKPVGDAGKPLGPTCDPDMTLFFQRTMKCWENGFKFGTLPLFIGACANCSAVIPNEARVKTVAASQQPKVFMHYAEKDVALKVVHPKTKKCYACTLCASKDLLTRYRLAPEQVKSLPLPKVITDVSDDDKRHISLVALKSSTAKASNEALRIFRHLKGDYIVQRKGEACYFDMYAMIVNRDPAKTCSSSSTIVVAALRWLRKNNHLYRNFAANYETLIRFMKRQPGQPVTVPVIDDMDFDPVSDKQTKTSVLDGEPAALMVPAYNVSSRGVDVGSTVTATQHVRSLQAAKQSHTNLVNVFVRDPYLEAKVFPWLFPYGIGGWSTVNGFCVTRSTYMHWRMRMYDGRFRDEADYMFYMLDILIKERLQYYASVKVNVARLVKPLTVQEIKTAGPYDQYGTEVPATIPNSRNYWASKTLDLIAMSEYMGRVPDFFVTLTENDSWPELQAIIRDGIAGVHQAPASKEFEDIHKRGAPAMKYPVQTVIAFYRRFQLFRAKFVQDPKGPFGKVLDYWMRIEYQKRGSLHAHLVVWCDKQTIPKGVVSAEMPRFEHPMNGKWRDIVGNYQKHTCSQQRCFTGKRGKVLIHCKSGYPFDVNDTVVPEKSGARYKYIRRSREDSSIVPYNLALLLLWDGHVNVQQVTNGGWELYLAKYVAKSEYPINMRFSRKRSDCETYLRTRVVSLLEAATLLLQRPHVFSSRDIIYLPIDVSPAHRFLKRASDLPAQTSAADSDDLYYDTKLHKYLDRPNALSHLTYPQFYAQYRYFGRAAKENEELDSDIDCDDDLAHSTGNETLRDRKGRQIRKRVRHEAVIRFKEYSPYGNDLERYCLTKLLQNVPVDRTSIAALKDTTGSYLDECLRRNLIREEDEAMQFLEGAAKRGSTVERLREIASRLIDGNWLQDQDIDQLLETVAPYHMQAERVRGEPVEDDDDDVIIDDRDGLDLNIRTYLPVEQYIAGFTASQRAAFDYVTSKWLKSEQCLVFITGGGGVGKSFLLDSFVAFCHEHHKTVQKLATTGCAAHLIGGLTIHTFLRMSIDLVSNIERGSTDAFFIDHLQVLLIDEVSMLDERVMQKLEECLITHSSLDDSTKRFAGKSIIMFGDPAQLPPIGKHIWQPTLLKGFEYVVLKEVVRQKDDRQFIDLLNRIRLGQPIQADIDLLKTREISQADLKQIDIGDGGLLLFPTRRQKDEMNELELAKLQVTERVYTAQDVDGNGMPLPKSVREYIADVERRIQLFPAVLKLKIGARVMLTRNRDIEHGWVNGTLALVVNMSEDYVVLAALDNPKKRLVTFRVKQEIRSKDANQQYFRKQFPLDLAYGVTIHKSQGQTLNVIAVSASGLSFSGQFYTAISRVREFTGLYLINFDPESIFLAPDLRRFINWINEVDIIRQRPPGWSRPPMPVVSQVLSLAIGYTTSVTVPPRVVQQVENTSKNKRPVQSMLPKATVIDNKQHDVAKRPRCETLQQLDVVDILTRIHRINPNVPLRHYWRALDVILNDDRVVQYFIHLECQILTDSLRHLYNDQSPHLRVDQRRSRETYAAISEDYGRVIVTSADGSCMFHALSLCLVGSEIYSSALRLASIYGFRQHNDIFETVHAQNHMDYTSVQKLIHQTSNMHGGTETWGGAAHLKSLACMTCREIYVYTSFTQDTNGRIHPRCLANRDLSVDELQRKSDDGTLFGAYFTRYEPQCYLSGRPLTVLLSGAGASAHYSAVLPVDEDAPMVIPRVVIPPNPENDEQEPVVRDHIDISESDNSC